MTGNQRKKQNMGDAVSLTLSNYASVYGGNPVITDSIEIHNANVEDVRSWQMKQAEKEQIPGLIEMRDTVRGAIIDELIIFIGAIQAWANQNNKFNIGAQVESTFAKLHKSNSSDFLAKAKIIVDIADVNDIALHSYGITEDRITAIQAKITEYMGLRESVCAKHDETFTATVNLKKAISNMMSHLKKRLDKNVSLYFGTPFFTAYTQSRKVQGTGTSTTIKGTIFNGAGHRIYKAEVSILNTGVDRSTLTNEKGNYKLKNLSFETCTMRVTANGCLPTERIITVKQGAVLDVDFSLQFAPAPVSPTPVLV